MNDDHWRVATFNANSIRTRLPQILDWLERTDVDVLAVQETKVQNREFPLDEFRRAGFYAVFYGVKGHSGVAVISRREPQQVRFGLDQEDEEEDKARALRCVIDEVPILNTYVPQGRDIQSPEFQRKLRWFARLRALLEREYAPDEPLLWLGDLNVAPEPIDVYDPKRFKDHVDFHPAVRQAFRDIMAWGLVDLFRRHHPNEPNHYTYYDYRAKNPVEENKGWRVDHILATAPLAERCINAWIDTQARLVERPSDHTFLVAEFSF
ncbi:MAG: exodeoxyribonuclease III [Chloroflexi bacterium]|nr:exodeoxyribonuclease III [Chloroflexota bacterium]